MKYIELTQGKRAIVDDSDFEWLNQWKWHYQPSRDKGGYAVRSAWYPNESKPRGQAIMMHHLINGTPEGFETDHENRNKLDNRRSNLKTVTRAENRYNTDLRADNTSGYTGVYWYNQTSRWVAKAVVDGRLKTLGYFLDKADAIKVRHEAVNDFLC